MDRVRIYDFLTHPIYEKFLFFDSIRAQRDPTSYHPYRDGEELRLPQLHLKHVSLNPPVYLSIAHLDPMSTQADFHLFITERIHTCIMRD